MEKSNLKIIRETDCEEMAIILKVTLENDVTLFVYEDGHAQGSDGKTYYQVMKKVISPKDNSDDTEILGWSCEIEDEIVI